MELRELSPHLYAQGRVQIRERLVHQEHLRLADQGATERDPLSLASRELGRPPVEQSDDIERGRDIADAGTDALARLASRFHAEAEVLPHRHMWVKGVALEDERNVAVLRWHAVDDTAADLDRPVRGPLEPGEHPQRGRLAASGRAHENKKLASLDREVEVADRYHATEELVHAFEVHVHLALRQPRRRFPTALSRRLEGRLRARAVHPLRLPPKLKAPVSRRAITR